MENKNCTYLDIEMSLPKIDFDSNLATLVIDLEKLRHRRLAGTAPFAIYDELRIIFQKLESYFHFLYNLLLSLILISLTTH